MTSLVGQSVNGTLLRTLRELHAFGTILAFAWQADQFLDERGSEGYTKFVITNDMQEMMRKPDTATPIEFTSVANVAHERIRSWILGGELSPGSRVTIRALAEWLGTSTTPVREALKQLQSESLIVAISRREFAVMKLSHDEVEEIFQIRLRLETLANEWAIKRVDHKFIRHLQGIIEEMEKPGMTPQRWRALNRQFHGDFYALSDSAYLLDLIESAWRRTEPYLAIYAINVGSFSEANEQHRDILESIRIRDLNSLQERIQQHMRYTCDAVCRALPDK